MAKGKVTEAIRFFEKCLKEKGLKVINPLSPNMPEREM